MPCVLGRLLQRCAIGCVGFALGMGVAVSSANAWQLFLGVPPEGFTQDPAKTAAREKELRAALAEPGYLLSERHKQIHELMQLLVMTKQLREAVAIWEPYVEQERRFGLLEGDSFASRDLWDLAELYQRVGDFEKAIAIYREQIDEMTRHYGALSIQATHQHERLIRVYLRAKKHEEAIDAWEKLTNVLPVHHSVRNALQINMLDAYLALPDEKRLDRIIQSYWKTYESDPESRYTLRLRLFVKLHQAGRADRAQALLVEELESLRKSKGPEAPETIKMVEQLGNSCLAMKAIDLGQKLYVDAIEQLEQKLGANHERTLRLQAGLAHQLALAGQSMPALQRFQELVPRLKMHLGVDHELTQSTLNDWAFALEASGKWSQAEPIRRELLAQREKSGLELHHPQRIAAQAALGANLLKQSQGAEAEAILSKVLKLSRQNEPMAWTTFNTASMLGEALLQQKKYDPSEKLLKEGFEGLLRATSNAPLEAHERRMDAAQRLVNLYEQTNRPEEAQKYRPYAPRVAPVTRP
jgi:tetratricopeptide (TPR) repeat protein